MSEDIAKNIKMIEFYKTELLSSLSFLYGAMFKSKNSDDITDALSDIVMTAYLLGKRLGMDYGELDAHMLDKIHLQIIEGHEAEKWYKDLSGLKEYISGREEG
ncbi:MAG: MazG-like family protein [Thermoanaerobacteraceae bacterium]|nr:MazG-like family protein [Thermoanaerobacteraceae bacterium]